MYDEWCECDGAKDEDFFCFCVFSFFFFFQAEDGIRDVRTWLEFRRVLFRSLRRKVRLCLYARWFSLGVAVAKRPILTIICVICGNLLCGIGLVNFHQIDPWEPIWTDKNSAFMRDRDWIQERFPSKFRINSYFVEADNVLDPQTLREVKLYYKTRLNPT